MEHKLIQGGEKYLPFARSRIKALRATGMQYASQRFVFPDGEVRVQIVDEQEYIHLSGGSTGTPSLDSGVVDVGNIALGNPATWLDGVLLEYGPAQRYNTAFLEYADNPPGRTIPAPTPPSSQGRLAGILTRSAQFNGRLLPIPPSFQRGTQAVSPATTPPSIEPNPADTALADKKNTAVLCPASIFTGRCRMYVQAMYGVELHTRNASSGAQTGTARIPTVVSDTSAAPALRVPAFKPRSTDTEQTVLIDTSTGVWLDPSDGKHWLFQVNSGAVWVYPLKASISLLEDSRKYLLASPTVDLEGMTPEDLEHLEAYILAYSLPDAKKKKYAGAYTTGSYSMGYGWHWNWDTTAADIVVNTQIAQGGGALTDAHMQSTHSRMTIAKNADQTWTASVSTVEGPSNWAVQRSNWQIVEPDYADFVLAKTTPKTTQMFVGGAPFYAFYVRNTLNVCRVDVVRRPGQAAIIVEDNCSGSNLSTVGLNEGDRRIHSAGAEYYEATFTCGGVSTPPLDYAHTISYGRSQIHNKVKNGWIVGFGPSGMGTWNITTSDDYGTLFSNETITDILSDSRQTNNTTHQVTTSSVVEAHTGQAQIVVPFYDSESVFMRSVRQYTSTITASSTTNFQHTAGGPLGAFLERDLFATEGYKYRALTNGAFAADNCELVSGPTANPDSTPVTDVSLQEVAILRGDSYPATFVNLSEFTDNSADVVGALYSTITGTSVADPIALSQQLPTQVGSNGLSAAAVPVIVGWV